jgi:hypothetical protein
LPVQGALEVNGHGTVQIVVLDAVVALHLSNMRQHRQSKDVVHGGGPYPAKAETCNEAAAIDVLVEGFLHVHLLRHLQPKKDAQVIGMQLDLVLGPSRASR